MELVDRRGISIVELCFNVVGRSLLHLQNVERLEDHRLGLVVHDRINLAALECSIALVSPTVFAHIHAGLLHLARRRSVFNCNYNFHWPCNIW